MDRTFVGPFGRVFAVSALLHGCSNSHPTTERPTDASFGDVNVTHPHMDATVGMDARVPRSDAPVVTSRDVNIPEVNRGEAPPPMKNFCQLPGSIVWSGGLPSVVPGGPGADAAAGQDLTWLKVPDGFCVHYFATVPETRGLRFSPSGDLFVAAPSTATAGGASGGAGAILILPDDDGDGVAEAPVTYVGGLAQTTGMLFYDGSFYYQNGETILKVPYLNGDRAPSGPSEQVIDVTVYKSPDHWAKTLDVDDQGHIFVTNGGDEGEACAGAAELGTDAKAPERPFHGGVLLIDGTPNGTEVARGLRNAIDIRCAKGTGVCFGLELAKDFAPEEGSREKLYPIRMGDDWGFPCCATANFAYTVYTDPTPNCSGVASEEDSFVIDHTPFGLDFEEGFWPGTWKYRAFVALHGYFGSWVGARVLAIQTGSDGWPVTAHETDAGNATMTDFATGWDDGKQDHGRPTAIMFAPDGRLFLGDDTNGLIVWMAPVTTAAPGGG
jgi:glucose/arabinose dehydrogenase